MFSICGRNAGDVPNNIGITPEIAPVHTVRGSNNVEWSIHDQEEPYENERAGDSDDDCPIPPLNAEDRELIRQVYPDIDPEVPEFSDVRNLDKTYAEGREADLLECREHGDDEVLEIKKGIVFRNLPTLRRWLQEYSVKRKRNFRVKHSYVQRCYIVVCDKTNCNWRVCARKQKVTEKFKITKVVGPHICAEEKLEQRHRQLTSTLIAVRLCSILKVQPNIKVNSIIEITEKLFHYTHCRDYIVLLY